MIGKDRERGVSFEFLQRKHVSSRIFKQFEIEQIYVVSIEREFFYS